MLDQLGNYIGELTGWNAADRQRQQDAITRRNNAQQQAQAAQQYQQYQQMLGAAFGYTPGTEGEMEYKTITTPWGNEIKVPTGKRTGGTAAQQLSPQQLMERAYDASKSQAGEAARAGASQALAAGRTAGLNPGQAAVMAGQQTGQLYNQAQAAALQQYNAQQAALMQGAGMGAQMANPNLMSFGNTNAIEGFTGLAGMIGGLSGVGSNIVGGGGAGQQAMGTTKGGGSGSGGSGKASLDKGTGYVPRDMEANIHKGEIVIPAKASEKIREKAGTMDVDKLSKKLNDALSIYQEAKK